MSREEFCRFWDFGLTHLDVPYKERMGLFSFWVANKYQMDASQQRAAGFKMEWMDKMWDHIATFYTLPETMRKVIELMNQDGPSLKLLAEHRGKLWDTLNAKDSEKKEQQVGSTEDSLSSLDESGEGQMWDDGSPKSSGSFR